MSNEKLTYEELEQRLAEAHQIIGALRGGEVDAIVTELDVALLRLKEVENALRRSEENYRNSIEKSPLGICIATAEGESRYANQAMLDIYGYSSLEELRAVPAKQRYTPECYVEHEKRKEKRKRGEYVPSNYEISVVRKDGEIRHLEVFRKEVLWNGKTQFQVLYQDITERKRAERELQEKTAALERFAYAISHDLKSPLVTVETFLGYLGQDLLSSDTGRIEKDMFYIRTAADKMGQLLGELLEVLRIGRIANPTVRVTFRELVEEALNVVAGPIAGREVKVQVNDAPITLSGDRPRLVEIWQNLVENAVKFMGDQASPRIEIGAERRGGDTVFFVRDNGIGIDPRHQAKVFDLFEKIGTESEGAGLGLALIKRIVELYRGTIWLESKGLGQGVCFLFTLPGAVKNQEEGEKP